MRKEYLKEAIELRKKMYRRKAIDKARLKFLDSWLKNPNNTYD